jgi:sporulation protein YlmC with PRC-barrel domain
MATVNLEHLAGRRVFSQDGKGIGYIQEMIAEQEGSDLAVTEFHIGIFAAFERLSASTIGTALLDVLGLRRREGLYRVPWDKIDISDPKRPRLLCPDEELAALRAQPKGK